MIAQFPIKSVRIMKVSGTKGGNQVVEIQKKSSKCVFSGTKKACHKYIQETYNAVQKTDAS